ncbi:hypothetical protein EB001_21815 [bacterium]|nr:hypothetical protein [bacterium]
MLKFISILITGFFLCYAYLSHVNKAHAAPKAPAKQEEKLVCDKKETVIKTFADAKFFPLLNMTNKEKVVETIWISGTSIALTASVPNEDTICLLAMMTDVVYNSDTVEGLYKVFEAQLNKEKGI